MMTTIDVPSLVTTAIGKSVDSIRQIAESAAAALSERDRKQLAVKVIDYLVPHVTKQRFGRIRAGLALAFALIPDNRSIWRHAVRRGVLSIGSPDENSRAKLWNLLLRDGADSLATLHQELPARITSLANLDEIRERLRPRFIWYKNSLRARPPGMLKSAMAYADLEFLRTEEEDELAEYTFAEDDHTVMIESREEITECISTLVAEALELRPMDSVETSMPVAQHLHSPELARLLSIAALRLKLRYLCKHVDALDYNIQRESTENILAYILVGPSPDHELWLRYGYVERQLADMAAPLNVDTGMPLVRIREVFQEFIRSQRESGQLLIEQADAPYRRFLVHLPWEGVFRTLLDNMFYEDAHEIYTDAQELQLDSATLERIDVAPTLSISDFLTLYRSLRYMALLHAEIITSIEGADREALNNSVLPLMQRTELISALAFTNIEISRIETFLRLISVDPGTHSHLDLQYKPLVSHKDHFLILPRLVASSGVLRNTLASARTRVPESGNYFASTVSEELLSTFKWTTTNRKIASPLGNTDIDVATLAQRKLYIWECKHSLPPTSPHEARGIWNDIENAIEQLDLARRILMGDTKLSQRLRSWFPGATDEELQIVEIIPVVMLSTRIWSGLHLRGIPIRDIHSLRRLRLRDCFGVPVPAREQHGEFEQFAMPETGPLSLAELDEYLRTDGRYWSLRRSWSRPFTVMHARTPEFVIGQATFIAGPFNYDGLVPDAQAHGYKSKGVVTRTPKLISFKDLHGKED